MPQGLSLRLATASDQAFLADLFRQTHTFLYAIDQAREATDVLINQQQQWQAQSYGEQAPNAHTFIIEQQSAAIGRLVIDFGCNIAHVMDIALTPCAQGKGYGKAVIQAVQQVAQQQSVPVGLSVHKSNASAKKLYQTLGFAVSEDLMSHEFLLWYPAGNKAVVMT